MDLDDILIQLGENLLPSGIQLALIVTALGGMLIIFSSFTTMYTVLAEDVRRTREGRRVSGLLLRMFIGGLMTVPSVILWRSADALIGGGEATNTAVLSYMGGMTETGYCDRFAMVITLAFMLVGVIAMFVGFRNIDDQARGFSQTSGRQGLIYLIGGVLCFGILDIVERVGNTVGVDIGFGTLCTALGG